jgi:hypothetical protein
MARADNTNDWNPDDIEALLEGVEEFERLVEERGGDLMVDEPPRNGSAQPDDPRFLLPKRRGDESVSSYLKRLSSATSGLRSG